MSMSMTRGAATDGGRDDRSSDPLAVYESRSERGGSLARFVQPSQYSSIQLQTRLMCDEVQRVPNKKSRITASGGVSIKHYACTEDATLHTDDVRLTT